MTISLTANAIKQVILTNIVKKLNMNKIVFSSLIILVSICACGQNKSQPTANDSENAKNKNEGKMVFSTPETQNEYKKTEVKKVTVAEAIALAKQGYQFVDLRTPKEIAEGKIEGALEMDVKSPRFIIDAKNLDSESKLILYCQSGTRSSLAAKLFSEIQFPNVVDMTGGYSAWVDYNNK